MITNLVAECYMLRSSAQAHLGQVAPAQADRQKAEELCPGINQRWTERHNKQGQEEVAQNSADSATGQPGGTAPATGDANAAQLEVLEQEFSLDSAQPGWWRGRPKGP